MILWYTITKMRNGRSRNPSQISELMEVKEMFKKFVQRIIDAKDREDAIQNVFYGADGIDIAFQKEKITWKEHEMLLALIEKMA